MGDFWQRLKQRKLVQWALAWVAFAFALLQGVDIVAAKFDWPAGIERGLIIALCIGFFIVLVLAWYHGERGAQRVGGVELLILALLLALGGGAMWYLARPPANAPATTALAAVNTPAATKPFNPPPDTLVVLPFTNLSGDPKQQYFSDGITEELTNALGQSTGLKVIAWDTASHFRDNKQSATDIGKTLNVSHVLTGRIQQQQDQVRVIVELVNARTGYQVWSNHYDDSLANVFQVQDRISAAIAQALKVKFADLGPARAVDPQAHDLVLKARALLQHAAIDIASVAHARELIEHALALDPDYADAHAALAKALRFQTEASKARIAEVLPQIRAEANKALALDPRNVGALIELGAVNQAEGKIAEARVALERALAIDPSSADAHVAYGNTLPFALGIREQQEALRLDPANVVAQYNTAWYLLDEGEYEEALAPAQAAIQLTPHAVDGAFMLAQAFSLLHRNEDAATAFDRVHPDTPLAESLAAAGRMTYRSLLVPELRPKALAAVAALKARSDLAPFQAYYVI